MDEARQQRERFAQDLREAREYHNIDLEQVAQETRISLPYLQALEAGDWESLPAPFLRGYLSAYAESLGMNLKKVLRRFDELGFLAPEATADPAAPPTARVPFSMGPRRPEEAAPLHAPPPRREDPVPTLLRALPMPVKAAIATGLVTIAGLLVWGLVAMVGAMLGSAEDAGPPEATLPEAPVEGEGDFPPFRVRLSLTQADRLSVLSSEGQLYRGTCPADSSLDFTSTSEVIVEVDHLERLRLWRDGQAHDLDTLTGARELRLLPGSVSIERRSSGGS